jgi:hypothetical protein
VAHPPSTSAGYSGKALIAKLGWRPEMTSVAVRPPANYAELTDAAPIAAAEALPAEGSYNFIHVFVLNAAELEYALPKLEPRLLEGGMIWVSWPKTSSALFADLTENGIRAVALPMGLVDVKVCAVDADWSGLKLMRRKTV